MAKTTRTVKIKVRMGGAKWVSLKGMANQVLVGDGFYLSYQPNDFGELEKRLGIHLPAPMMGLDSARPETAIVIEDGKGKGRRRFLIFRGDRRKELEALMPDLGALKEYWKEEGGHFWSDDLEGDE